MNQPSCFAPLEIQLILDACASQDAMQISSKLDHVTQVLQQNGYEKDAINHHALIRVLSLSLVNLAFELSGDDLTTTVTHEQVGCALRETQRMLL